MLIARRAPAIVQTARARDGFADDFHRVGTSALAVP